MVAGVSEKVLIQQLRELAVAGVLTRRNYQRVPPMVDYTMTAFGMTLARALMPLCAWGTEHRDRIAEIMLSRSPDPQSPGRPTPRPEASQPREYLTWQEVAFEEAKYIRED